MGRRLGARRITNTVVSWGFSFKEGTLQTGCTKCPQEDLLSLSEKS